MGPITIHLLSDSLGETADAVARAAASQFEKGTFRIERLPRVISPTQLREAVTMHCGQHCVFFYTLAETELRQEMERLVATMNVNGLDLMGPGVELLSRVAGVRPHPTVGALRRPDEAYFERIGAMEFAIKHDDGQHPEGLHEADVVLIGVSRTSKTPLSMYLAAKGFKAANIPLAPGVAPPHELFEVDPRRVFGLVSDPDVLSGIRAARMSELGTYVPHYAERNDVEDELGEARQLMRRLGCIVVRTDNRAIEESAQDVIRHLRGHLSVGND